MDGGVLIFGTFFLAFILFFLGGNAISTLAYVGFWRCTGEFFGTKLGVVSGFKVKLEACIVQSESCSSDELFFELFTLSVLDFCEFFDPNELLDPLFDPTTTSSAKKLDDISASRL